jgi:hypothetical protein
MTASATIAPGPQHLRALQRANEVRLARADLKRRISSGERSVSDVVLSKPWEAESMTISDLLTAQRRWGHTRCRRFLQAVPMSETKTVGSMTDRQRHAIADMLQRAGEERRRPAPAAASVETADAVRSLTAACA